MAKFAIDSRHQERHLREHRDFLRELSRLQQNLIPSDASRGENLLQFLQNWLAYHLLGSDKSLSRQISAIESGQCSVRSYELEEEETDLATRTLLAALNNLFQQAMWRNEQLVEMNRTLEKRVEQRTRELSVANRNLETLALTDTLTGLPNRRHAMRWLNQLWDTPMCAELCFSCMMLDIDGFKQINDRHGHDTGDAVLLAFGTHLHQAVRSADIVCRLGGDEFLILCPETPLKGALHLAEAIRSTVTLLRIPQLGPQWQGSVSIGVAARKPEMKRPEDLIKFADEGVYAAKRDGRNCTRSGG